MSKGDFIPAADNDFLLKLGQFLAALPAHLADYGVPEKDLAALQAALAVLQAKIVAANEAAAAARQATAEKNDARIAAESLFRAMARHIKNGLGYNPAHGAHLGIEGPDHTVDLTAAKPVLTGSDQTGGVVLISFSKLKSDGINLYCQREGDTDWVLLGRVTVSPFRDTRPLLVPGKPELRRYTAVFVKHDQEIGQFSDELVINCAP